MRSASACSVAVPEAPRERSAPAASTAERLLVLVALGPFAVACGLLVAGLVTSWQGFLVAFLGLVVTVTGIWRALAYEGPSRLVAIVLALAGSGLVVRG
jgi:hypothetical protein